MVFIVFFLASNVRGIQKRGRPLRASVCGILSQKHIYSAFACRNINNRDVLVTLALLIETTKRAPGILCEGPAEQTFKFCTGNKKKKCVKFTEGTSETSRDYWKLLSKLARLRQKRCRGHWRRGIKYAPPCLASVFANFRWNMPQWTRELLAKSSYCDKVLSSRDGFVKIQWSHKHTDQLICGCGCCELFLERQDFEPYMSIQNILWRWKKFVIQDRTWKSIVEEWFEHQNRYSGDLKGAEFADVRVCSRDFFSLSAKLMFVEKMACRMLDINPDIADMHHFVETATNAMETQENKRFLNHEEFLKISM